MATKGNSDSTATIEMQAIGLETVEIPIEGVTELIVHRWSAKAKKAMLDKQMGVAKQKKEAKVPEEDYEDSMYRLDDGGYGFPATGFKAAIVGACRLYDDLPMTRAKMAIYVEGEMNQEGEVLVRIEATPRMREDMVRLQTGVADIRYRAGFPKWRATLKVTCVKRLLSVDQLINLVNAAGLGGIGEWRPSAPKSATGSYGRFRVAL